MNWWRRIGRHGQRDSADTSLNLEIPGWNVSLESTRKKPVWRDADGDVLRLTFMGRFIGYPVLSDETKQRLFCRRVVQAQNAGLIEINSKEGINGPALSFIYKQFENPGFVFTGMLMTLMKWRKQWAWVMVAGERGTTGIREAIVTKLLMDERKLTLETYESFWAQDPYDPDYTGVDHSSLRYMSDDERYDSMFPHHPLSKVRRELKKLLEISLDKVAL